VIGGNHNDTYRRDAGYRCRRDVVPPGYPIAFNFLPDLEAFYADWLGEPL
jgi:acetone carboxylase gamma subunit